MKPEVNNDPSKASLPIDEKTLEKMFQTFTQASEQLQESHFKLEERVLELTQELEEKNKELRRKERLAVIGEMSASIAHEIRNPLGGIELYASLISRSVEEKEKELCAKICSGVSSLNKIVEDLLDYAKDHQTEFSVVSMQDFFKSIKDCVGLECEKKIVKIEIPEFNQDVSFVCDKQILFQCILNLVRNAVQAVNEKDGLVRMELDLAENNIWAIHVEDNGKGISKEESEKIFNPFYTTKSTGSGLGLALVNRFAEIHNGEVLLHKSPLGGAKFTIKIPKIKLA